MSDSYTSQILRIVVAQVALKFGFQSAAGCCLDVLEDVLRKRILETCQMLKFSADHLGHIKPRFSELKLAFAQLGIDDSEVAAFFDSTAPTPSSLSVPKYPVRRSRVIIKSHSADASSAQYRPHFVPRFLPPLASDKKQSDIKVPPLCPEVASSVPKQPQIESSNGDEKEKQQEGSSIPHGGCSLQQRAPFTVRQTPVVKLGGGVDKGFEIPDDFDALSAGLEAAVAAVKIHEKAEKRKKATPEQKAREKQKKESKRESGPENAAKEHVVTNDALEKGGSTSNIFPASTVLRELIVPLIPIDLNLKTTMPEVVALKEIAAITSSASDFLQPKQDIEIEELLLEFVPSSKTSRGSTVHIDECISSVLECSTPIEIVETINITKEEPLPPPKLTDSRLPSKKIVLAPSSVVAAPSIVCEPSTSSSCSTTTATAKELADNRILILKDTLKESRKKLNKEVIKQRLKKQREDKQAQRIRIENKLQNFPPIAAKVSLPKQQQPALVSFPKPSVIDTRSLFPPLFPIPHPFAGSALSAALPSLPPMAPLEPLTLTISRAGNAVSIKSESSPSPGSTLSVKCQDEKQKPSTSKVVDVGQINKLEVPAELPKPVKQEQTVVVKPVVEPLPPLKVKLSLPKLSPTASSVATITTTTATTAEKTEKVDSDTPVVKKLTQKQPVVEKAKPSPEKKFKPKPFTIAVPDRREGMLGQPPFKVKSSTASSPIKVPKLKVRLPVLPESKQPVAAKKEAKPPPVTSIDSTSTATSLQSVIMPKVPVVSVKEEPVSTSPESVLLKPEVSSETPVAPPLPKTTTSAKVNSVVSTQPVLPSLPSKSKGGKSSKRKHADRKSEEEAGKIKEEPLEPPPLKVPKLIINIKGLPKNEKKPGGSEQHEEMMPDLGSPLEERVDHGSSSVTVERLDHGFDFEFSFPPKAVSLSSSPPPKSPSLHSRSPSVRSLDFDDIAGAGGATNSPPPKTPSPRSISPMSPANAYPYDSMDICGVSPVAADVEELPPLPVPERTVAPLKISTTFGPPSSNNDSLKQNKESSSSSPIGHKKSASMSVIGQKSATQKHKPGAAKNRTKPERTTAAAPPTVASSKSQPEPVLIVDQQKPTSLSETIAEEKEVFEVVSNNEEEDLPENWVCPICNVAYVEGSDMIACESCDFWFHWYCVGILVAPPESEQWFCEKCKRAQKNRAGNKKKPVPCGKVTLPTPTTSSNKSTSASNNSSNSNVANSKKKKAKK